MLGLSLVGAPHPVSPDALRAALGGRAEALPEAYVVLMAAWGPGLLCGAVELPDPTSARFRFLQHRLWVDGAARRAAGAWGGLSDEAFRGGVVLGVDRRGFAYFARGAADIAILEPEGSVLALGSFEYLVGSFLLGGVILATQRALLTDHVRRSWGWTVQHLSRARRNELGVPAIYETTAAPAPRAALLAAWAAGDEAAADAALAQVLEREVAGWALLELLHYLASPAAAAIPREIRATYADQLYRMASRRVPELVPELPIRELRIALGTGELAPEQLASIAALIDPPAGIFASEPDAAEAALLAALAAEPADDGARLVYADHLEGRGELARAEALRSDAAQVAPLPDAAQRGFLASPGLPPVDGAARVRARLEAWEREAPAFSTAAAAAKIQALHPTARQGYEILLEQQRQRRSFWQTPAEVTPYTHLEREIRDAWPQLALALRDPPYRAFALEILAQARVREAAPFLLSCLRERGVGADRDWLVAVADRYVELVKVKRAVAEEFAAAFADPGATSVDRAIAFRLCVELGADDRVFEAALARFCAAYPFSEKILRKRKSEPRVREVLGARLAVERQKSLRDGGRTLSYTPELGLLARYLAKLGDPDAQELAERYKKFKRWADYVPREPL